MASPRRDCTNKVLAFDFSCLGVLVDLGDLVGLAFLPFPPLVTLGTSWDLAFLLFCPLVTSWDLQGLVAFALVFVDALVIVVAVTLVTFMFLGLVALACALDVSVA